MRPTATILLHHTSMLDSLAALGSDPAYRGDVIVCEPKMSPMKAIDEWDRLPRGFFSPPGPRYRDTKPAPKANRNKAQRQARRITRRHAK